MSDSSATPDAAAPAPARASSPPPAPDAERTLAAALWAATAFAAVYLLQGALRLPGLIYDPAAHHWLIAPGPTGVQMRFYSDVLGAALAGGAAYALRMAWKSARSDLGVLAGSALSVLLLDLAWFFSRILSALR